MEQAATCCCLVGTLAKLGSRWACRCSESSCTRCESSRDVGTSRAGSTGSTAFGGARTADHLRLATVLLLRSNGPRARGWCRYHWSREGLAGRASDERGTLAGATVSGAVLEQPCWHLPPRSSAHLISAQFSILHRQGPGGGRQACGKQHGRRQLWSFIHSPFSIAPLTLYAPLTLSPPATSDRKAASLS